MASDQVVTSNTWKIHKFGGSSLKDAGCFRAVADIIAARPDDTLGVIVSAMGGMTDDLLRLSMLAERDDKRFAGELQQVGERYTTVARQLIKGGGLVTLLDRWSQDASHITQILTDVALAKSAPQRTRDIVAGFGEIWSARLLATYLGKMLAENRGGHWFDARQIITVRESELGPAVLWDRSGENWQQVVGKDFAGVAVFTGFIATDDGGRQTTLGRNGSDHSAAIMAALSGASQLTIWTDVDGVMSADPNKVPDSQVIDALSYNEAMELAYFGANVLHPQTLGPAISNDIPVVIRNTFRPGHAGSRITALSDDSGQIKGITAVGSMALLNLEGAGMIGVPGTADRLFAALKKADVSVTLISQASSEHSICVAVPRGLVERAKNVVTEAFADELASGQIQNVEITDNLSIVAVVGDDMAGSPGLAARFFGTLGRARINVRAIAQGSSERNISAVVDAGDTTRALRAAHSGFYLSSKTISVGLIGPGTVGGALLDQIHQQSARLLAEFNLDLRVRAIARSTTMCLAERRIDLENWRDESGANAVALDLDAFERQVHPDHIPHAVIIDCSASDAIADRYATWLRRGIHIVTPNKKAFSGPLARYYDIRRSAVDGGAHFFYETTVGAALPIIKTLRDLIDTGDRIQSVQGILSGTLAYLFNVFDGKKPFSEIVSEAQQNGFTEPDPRDDLSGMDVARKLTILARELGQEIELGQFPVQNLIPESLREVEIAEFLERLADYDDEIAARYASAKSAGMNLRYIASLDADGSASVELKQVAAESAFSHIELTDNLVQFASDRYSANPLVIQGPGAGPDVTAAGVFGDLLKLAHYLDDGSIG
jgi:bifunctional aspartokinase / homoserine dehydrogenase 1